MELTSFTIVLMGAVFGLSAGMSPGPLLTLVITQTLKHNRKEGVKVAFVPIITDFPIIATTFFIFSRFSQTNLVLSIISFIGAVFIAYLGIETMKIKDLSFNMQNAKPNSIKKGIIANLLNPNPYIFWLTVGTPTAFKAYENGLFVTICYFLSFYICLVGSKTILAFIVDKSKSFIKNKIYLWTMRMLGIALLIFSVLLFYDGFNMLD